MINDRPSRSFASGINGTLKKIKVNGTGGRGLLVWEPARPTYTDPDPA
jgi:hypothetical protein